MFKLTVSFETFGFTVDYETAAEVTARLSLVDLSQVKRVTITRSDK